MNRKIQLSVNDHRRDSAGLVYVYPVVSRRAGGVSIGINLNPNNACNWACVYCQVPDLRRGGPPPIDLGRLGGELRGFLGEAMRGDYLVRHVPEDARRLVDVAFSGNGEPTTAAEFADAVDLVGQILGEEGLVDRLVLRLITNGSQLHRAGVRRGIARLGELRGEVWFKLDRASTAGMALVNGVRRTPGQARTALLACADLAPTWLQTCWFAIDGQEPVEAEQLAYLEFVESVRERIEGVHLYGIARPSMQPAAASLSGIGGDRFDRFADRVAGLGVKVVANP